MTKKPDNIAFNEELQSYNANTLPYASNVSAPKIELSDISHWKNNTVNKVNHQLGAKFEELKKEYENLIQQYEYNKLIYEAKFSFEPVIGKIYHLYKKDDESTFLSILNPQECHFNYLKSFRLNADQIWEVVTNPV